MNTLECNLQVVCMILRNHPKEETTGEIVGCSWIDFLSTIYIQD